VGPGPSVRSSAGITIDRQAIMHRLSRSASAKINLGLRVVARRASGYHELQSLFVPLDLADEIAIEVAAGSVSEIDIEVVGRSEGVPADRTNLAARAAAAFVRAAGLRVHIRLRVDKRIPNGAGLGGGSSDAGAVLRALRDTYPEALSGPELARVALGLGADVPFFLDPRPTWVTGIGEHLEPVSAAPALPILLANPGEALPTARVFQAFDEAGNATLTPAARDRTIPPSQTTASAASGLRWDTIAPRAQSVHNDLQAAAVSLCPSVATLIEQIRNQGPRQIGMSGSGPTVFGVFESLDSAQSALEKIGFESPIWARVATTIESR
jgi:4-diphosphocytidyl-2-C-methyl-D-erythritol kinase